MIKCWMLIHNNVLDKNKFMISHWNAWCISTSQCETRSVSDIVLAHSSVSSYWLCSTHLEQGHLQGGDLREKKKHCSGGKYGLKGWQTGERWGEMIIPHKTATPSSVPWWEFLRGSTLEGFSLPYYFPVFLDCPSQVDWNHVSLGHQ